MISQYSRDADTTHNVCCRLQHLLVDARHGNRRQKDEVLATHDLTIHIFVIVSVESGDASRVADPEVDRIGLFFKSDSCPSDLCFDIAVQSQILVSEVVVLLGEPRLALADFHLVQTRRYQ